MVFLQLIYMFLASWNGKHKVAQLLLSKNVSMNAITKDKGESALHYGMIKEISKLKQINHCIFLKPQKMDIKVLLKF